jgi:hypothetical protein
MFVYRPADTYNIADFCMLVRITRHATMTHRHRQIGTSDRRTGTDRSVRVIGGRSTYRYRDSGMPVPTRTATRTYGDQNDGHGGVRKPALVQRVVHVLVPVPVHNHVQKQNYNMPWCWTTG